METELRVVIVEDSEDDAGLVLRQLRSSGYAPVFKRVDTAADMKAVLTGESWDFVISDYAMPGFNGLAALELAKEYAPDVPFIIVSGTIGEEVAVAAMRAGAHDYVMKDNLARLGPAIKRELEEAGTRRERRHAEEVLFQQKERAQVTLQSIGDGVITSDVSGRVEYMNPVAERLTGWQDTEARGQPLMRVLTLVDELTRRELPDPIEDCLRERNSVSFPASALLIQRHRNEEYFIEVTTSPLRDHQGAIIGCVLVLHDVTELRGMARQMSYLATHDALTGLVNRREFEARLKSAINRARRERLEHAMCYLDLDQFKVVNDTCGHIVGDELLKQLAAQLQTVIRDTDTLARLGGDEFGVLLDCCPLDKAEEVANALRNVVKAFRFAWQDKIFEVGVSIGLVAINADSGGLADVMSAADSACYVAKDHGRNRVHVFQADDIELADRHGEMQWVSQITQAVEEQRLVLYSQSIVPLNDENPGGGHYELLLRMRDRDENLVLPGMFIPAAERYNLMPTLDRWVVRTAFAYLAGLRERQPAYRLERDTCAINLSGTTLSDDMFLDFVQGQLKKYRLPPPLICFEITETAAIANLASASHLIRELKRLGCRFALDDFGTGLSSFAYLKNLPVDYLKIDGSFVRDMPNDALGREIVRSINEIGHVMGIQTIAESVENQTVLVQVGELGVDFAQGYAIERPQPVEEMLRRMLEKSG